MAWVMEILKKEYKKPTTESNLQAGRRIFMENCAGCHGANLKGTGNNPNISDVHLRYQKADFLKLVAGGRRMMPAFRQLSTADKNALASYILNLKDEKAKNYVSEANKYDLAKLMPYKMNGYNKFLSPEGLPGIAPPWGTLNAINLNTGEIAWKVPLGSYEALKGKTKEPTGSEGYGGPVVTKGGLIFIAAARDGKIRAFNKYSGKLLWEYELPAPGFASPAVYELNGKQYLVIACGGGKLGTKSSDAYEAFALKD